MMATIKKNQLANIIFPIVDGTDFASIESGLTASNFESKMTKKFFGVTHGNSTAFTSGTISKAATLVRSGIFQQTLKTTETNYDYLLVSFAPANTSLAHQILVFHPVDYDDSDLMSRISDVGSDLRSYLVGMSGMLSDVDSQLLLNASMISDVYSNLSDLKSDFQSRVPKAVATNSQLSDLHSDLRSYLVGMSGMLSDVDSQLNLVPVSISASDMSDIVSRVWAAKYTAHSAASSFGSLFSDVYSRLALTQSNVSDIQSALDSQFVWTSAFLSDMNSDLSSQIGGITASVSASDISDIASRVWSEKYNTYSAVASSFGSFVTQQTQGASNLLSSISALVSDVDSALTSQFTWTSAFLSDMNSDLSSQIGGITASVSASDISDITSAVWGYPLASRITTMSASDISDLRSAIAAGPAATVTASDISDIASAVWANTIGARVDSRILVVQSMVSDVDSQVNLLATSNYLSQVHSDLASAVGAVTASVSVSDISDIASAVWANTIGARVDSRVLVIQSMVSDVDSQLLLNASMISDVQSALDSQFLIVTSNLSDVESAVDALNDPTASAVASAVWGEHYNTHSAVASTFGSFVTQQTQGASNMLSNISALVSDVDSQLLLNASMISDIDSQLTENYSLLSDIDSQLLLNASMISDIDSQLTENYSLLSDIDSQLLVTHSLLSDVESAVDALWTTQLTEAYNADGTAPTPAQALFVMMQMLTEFSISGTTLTVKKLDGSTTAATFTLNDATSPTSLTRAT